MDIHNFKDSVDSWIKDINGKVASLEEMDGVVAENASNVQHNYELIYEMKDQIEELRMEIRKLKLMQLVTLKKVEIKH